MLGDLLYAAPAALVGLLGGWALDRARARAPARSGAVAAALAAAMLALALAAQFSFAFHGYVSDLWLYLTVAERVADGAQVLDREPFWLEPPGSAMRSVQWIGLGLAERAVGLPTYTGARIIGLASLAFLAAVAWWLARDAFDAPAARSLALVCFVAGLQQEWAALALNRNVAFGF
ncbi:MAG: hypothetical protein V3U03_08625, partial [Myxococcota bacterium]